MYYVEKKTFVDQSGQEVDENAEPHADGACCTEEAKSPEARGPRRPARDPSTKFNWR